MNKPGFSNNNPGCLEDVGAKCQGRFAIAVIDAADGRDCKGGYDGYDKDHLANNHRLLSVEGIERTKGSSPG